MTSLAHSIPLAALVAVALVPAGGCSADGAGSRAGASPSASMPEAGAPTSAEGPRNSRPENAGLTGAQRPLAGHTPLFHVTSETGGERHEFDTVGGFVLRFACRGTGRVSVQITAADRYSFACSPAAPEQRAEYVASDNVMRTYDVRIQTEPKNVWSIFLDQKK